MHPITPNSNSPEVIGASLAPASSTRELGQNESGSKEPSIDASPTSGNTANNPPNDTESDHSRENQNNQIPRDRSFSIFGTLPIELRYRIWEHFCPELVQPSRIYAFAVSLQRTSQHPLAPAVYVILKAHSLASATSGLRTVLAVHQESRKLALCTIPNTLPVMYGEHKNKQGDIRFNSCRDIVLLPETIFLDRRTPLKVIPVTYLDRVQNLAVNSRTMRITDSFFAVDSRFPEFRNLKRVYCEHESDCIASYKLRWVTSEKCCSQIVERAGAMDWPLRFCWPGYGLQISEKPTRVMRRLRPMAEKAGLELYPLISFSTRFGWEQYELIQQTEKLLDEEFMRRCDIESGTP